MVPAAVGGLSLGGLALTLLLNYLSGGNITDVLSQINPSEIIRTLPQAAPDAGQYEGEDAYELFASTVLGSNDEVWSALFSNEGMAYDRPQLVLFRTATESECGVATSEVGPHYCFLDNTIYLDETFFQELTNRFGAKGGDVAQGYVIAHEVGHHVQNQLGTLARAGNQPVEVELQADCFAGVWAHYLDDKNIFEPGEINEAVDAAAAVGDDRIQSRVLGYINPETWTHGSSAQRVQWFNAGYKSGQINDCNTFQ
jgi:uncharacterized protein